ncbi:MULTISPECIES: Lrp/AsnC family transcriptional regulator [unclassified Bordetella]|uniref:Lrp/AsnC family transcriptional regulator n=1 Tax=unclassified Bordetella TaxID=2630031 RepID=UPI001321C922|nr:MULTISPECIES: Lrp/AsnC family transcriptional regulator [unclassified Bordetella]MVW71579.1 winged helix-turn-helix transcriptional regulator [Bordetella sp. 15P40C-2]MVW79719.1 winged helix-turn-helix transcriptional regulator [Bordetella sp. 02P26C-1]
MQIDTIDQRILARLQEDGSLSNQDLADQVALSPSACLRRVRALEEAGLIRAYRAVLDAEKLGFDLEAIVHVSLDQSRAGWHEEFLACIALHDEITEASIVTGASNYILRVRTRNLSAFSNFVEDKLSKLPGVRNLCSHIVMRKVKNRDSMLPLANWR